MVFQLHFLEEKFLPLKVLNFGCFTESMFIGSMHVQFCALRESQTMTENLIFENTSFANMPNSR